MSPRKFRRLRWLGVVLTAALAAGTAACSADSSTSQGGTTNPTFVYAAAGVPAGLDVWKHYEGDASRLVMYEWASTLVEFDANKVAGGGCDRLADASNLSPRLAEKWDYSPDRKQLLFTLRQGVQSPAGNAMTAQDVVWTLDRANKLSNVARFLMFDVAKFDKTKPFEAKDDRTVAVNLTQPTSLDVAIFTYPMLGVIDSTEAKKNANGEEWAETYLATAMPNFGPWKLDQLQPSSQIDLSPNPNFWDKANRGNLGKLVIRSVPDASTRLQLVETGQADYAERLSFDQYTQVDKSDRAQLINCVSPNRDTLMLNQKSGPFTDPNVRKAISMAIDRQALVTGVYKGLFKPATTGLSEVYWTPGPDAKKFEFDPEQAKTLLQQAGVGNLSFEILASPTRPGAYAQSLAVQIQNMLKNVGVTASVKVIPGATEFSDTYFKGNYQGVIYLEPPAVGDPFYSLNLYNTTVSFQNSFGYNNKQYDELVAKVLTTAPGPDRDALLAQASDLIVETTPQVYLVEQRYLHALGANVQGYQNTPTGQLFTYRMKKG
ncbi:ABC transporter substrate-binding protein [Paractinoplanes rhizophilus]|jgi:peptide/nickel transport system substrate-binding protein|uniref:ABC transporter substrate-binding protein n=1 Tax=Paractinoplanes rhizophilus TaxID=1416877 RepID=A0ABW2HX35_9ACTN|nr:ABC transporter substrate-binding protein [Actinoplanes sp.]